ncbi:MAG: nucleotidyltransferase domain-containing protein [Flavobacteriales bacterium]|nr:nucleotidyltransferase domain-containing protein [Flavobacteriales bacterium]
MLDLKAEYLNVVLSILRKQLPHAQVWAFGARVSGHAKRHSDLELAVKGEKELDVRAMTALNEAFSASGLPIHVHVLDLHCVSPEFLSEIQDELVPVIE